MMNGIVIRRAGLFLARGSARSAEKDEEGYCWSKELQAARVYSNHDMACRLARRIGGQVLLMKDGRVQE